MTYLQFAEARFRADATVRGWLSIDMEEHPAVQELLANKPDEIGVMSWLVNNNKVNRGLDYRSLDMLARGVIIPEFFQRYEQVVLDAYKARGDAIKAMGLKVQVELLQASFGDYQARIGTHVVELPEVPRGLSAEATEHHERARSAVAGIYLKKNGELMPHRPTFGYVNDYALFLCSTGPPMSSVEVSASVLAFGQFYENATW
jgi:hypothetical protein